MHFNTIVHLGYLEHKAFARRTGLRLYSFPEYRDLMNQVMSNVTNLGVDPDEMIRAILADISRLQKEREEYAAEFEARWSMMTRAERLGHLGACDCEGCARLFRLAILNPHIEA